MPKPNGQLILKRVGSFDINVTGKNHCGTRNPLNIQYQVEVTCTPVLDDRGFLFDQINVQHFFESVTNTSQSCENLSIDLSRKLWKRIQLENPDCDILEMSMTLAASPYKASMTFNFKKDVDPPPSNFNELEKKSLELEHRVDAVQVKLDEVKEDLLEKERDNDELAKENEALEEQIASYKAEVAHKNAQIINAKALLSHWLRGGLRGAAREALKTDTRKWLPPEPNGANTRSRKS